jgi:hypothetical protein
VQPRLGFSYDVRPDGRTQLFGGAGRFYDRIFADILLDERLRTQRPRYNFFFRRPGDPAAPNTVEFTPALLAPGALAALVASGQANRPEAFLVPDDLRPPRSDQANLGVRHQVGTYQLQLTGSLVNGTNGFRYVWGQREVRPGADFGAFRPIPGFGAILRATDAGRTWYRALLFQASRPLTEQTRWGGDLSYTLAKSETNTRNGDDPFALDYVSEANFFRIRSPFDERHRVVLNLVTRIPGDVRVSTLTTLGSGFPYITSTNCDETQAQLAQKLAATPADERLRFCQTNGYVGNGNGADWDDNRSSRAPPRPPRAGSRRRPRGPRRRTAPRPASAPSSTRWAAARSTGSGTRPPAHRPHPRPLADPVVLQHRGRGLRAHQLPRGRGARLGDARGRRARACWPRCASSGGCRRGPQPRAWPGTSGFFYHFLDMETGRASSASSSPPSTRRCSWPARSPAASTSTRRRRDEREIRALADSLYRRVDWNWARDGARW